MPARIILFNFSQQEVQRVTKLRFDWDWEAKHRAVLEIGLGTLRCAANRREPFLFR
jgi:hypothetical protein